MSESHSPMPGQKTPVPEGDQGSAADPSMEDILASIRRILSEDEAEAPAVGPAPGPTPSGTHHDDVVDLDASMIVDDAAPRPVRAERAVPPPVAPAPTVTPPTVTPLATTPAATTPAPAQPRADGLVAPEAAAAAAGSVGALLRSVVAGREQVAVHRGGPTLEDMVREEIRPLVKQWLDVNLPPLVERLVRAEIERVVGRVS